MVLKKPSLFSVQGYRLMPFHRKISANNRYYGGSIIFIKNELRSGIKVVGSLGGDKVWIKLKKTFFNFNKDIYYCFNYAPPASSLYAKNLDYDIFQMLEEDISRYGNEGNIMLAGD